MNQKTKQNKQKYEHEHVALNISDYVHYLTTKNSNDIYMCPYVPNSQSLSNYLEIRVHANQVTSD